MNTLKGKWPNHFWKPGSNAICFKRGFHRGVKMQTKRRHKTDCRRTHQEAIRNQTVSEFPSPKMLSEVRALDRTLDPRAVRSRFRSGPVYRAQLGSRTHGAGRIPLPQTTHDCVHLEKGPLTTPGLSAQLVAIDHGFGGDNVFTWFARDLDGSPALQLDVIDQ